MAASLLTFLAPSATSEVGDTFPADWDGVTYNEQIDPLARFVEFPVLDLDGDGFVSLTPFELPAETLPELVDLSEVTNAAIESQMLLLGITRDDIIAQIDLLLTPEPDHHDERDGAIANVQAGDFLAAAAGLTGTAADISFWCGSQTTPREVRWVIAIPIVANCDGSGGTDTTISAEATFAFPSGTRIDDIDLEVDFVPVLTSGATLWGAMYGGHNLGSLTTQKTLRYSVQLRDLVSATMTAKIVFAPVLSSFSTGNSFYYTFGATPTRDKTVFVDLSTSVSTYTLEAKVINRGSLDFDVTVKLGSVSTISRIRADLTLAGGGKRVLLTAKNVPSTLTFGFTTKSDAGGQYFDVRLSSPSSLLSLEIAGTYHEAGGAAFTFQFVGFPNSNTLRIAPGPGPFGCSRSSNIFSLDLTKGSSSVGGRYRTFLADGHVCDKDISVTGVSLHRAKIYMGGEDRFDGDGNRFIGQHATASQQSDSRLTVDTDVPWLPDYFGEIKFRSTSVADWKDTLGLVTVEGTVNLGSAIEDDGFLLNVYFWNIANSQLSLSTCISNHKWSNGRCV